MWFLANWIHRDLCYCLNWRRSSCSSEQPSQQQQQATSPPAPISAQSAQLADTSAESDAATLQNITIRVKEGELCAIVGAVGSGKSSILMSALGELPAKSGDVTVVGRVGYVPQDAWIVSGSVRDNILGNRAYDPDWYARVVYACALQPDIDMFEHGDETLVRNVVTAVPLLLYAFSILRAVVHLVYRNTRAVSGEDELQVFPLF